MSADQRITDLETALREAIRLAEIFRDKVPFLTLSEKSYDEFEDAMKKLSVLRRDAWR